MPTAPATPAARRAPPKSARRRSRELALQGLYQWLLAGDEAAVVDAHMREQEGFDKADRSHFDALLHGCIEAAATLDAAILPLLDRKMNEISPVEHAVLWIGAYEFQQCPDVPWRVVINECIELAKAFGGTDGHKWVNGVLNQLAPSLRPAEVASDKAR